MESEEYLTIVEIARRLRVSKMTVYRLVRTGELPGFQIGRSYRVSRVSYENYVKEAIERGIAG